MGRAEDRRIRYMWIGLAVVVLSLSTTVWAQTSRNGSIAGTITDRTGGALPGVTVTVTSPQLQVPQLVTVSEPDGTYKFPDLPIGTFRLAYELSGFSTFVREDIRLSLGFAARLDVTLSVATLTETVIVSGQSPVVDTTNTRGGTTVTQQLLSSTPNNMNYQDVMGLVAGVTVNRETPLSSAVAGTNLGSGSNITYGQRVRMNNWIEGLKAAQAETPDFLATEEMDVKTFGNTAENDLPGANIQMIYKSGGNQFHGRVSQEYQHERFQSSNIDDALRRQGITAPNSAKYVNKTGGDLGGRIIRNKLWFYTSTLYSESRRRYTGFIQDAGADGEYFTGDDVPGVPKLDGKNFVGKLSYQASTKHKFIGYGQYDPVWDEVKSTGSVSRFIPYEATRESTTWTKHYKLEWQGVFSERLYANMIVGGGGYKIIYRPHPDLPLTTCRFFRDTQIYTGNGCGGFVSTGATGSAGAPYLDRSPMRTQWSGNLTYYPRWSVLGSHEITSGYIYVRGRLWVEVPDYGSYVDVRDKRNDGMYLLTYDRVPGGAYRPIELSVADVPTRGGARQDSFGTFVSDTWHPTKRLTVNAGLRWERALAFVEPAEKVQGVYGFGGSFARVDIGTWSGFAPRVGGAFDLNGNGKTVVKATYGLFNHSEFNNFGNPLTLPTPFNKNSPSTYTYRWNVPGYTCPTPTSCTNDYTSGQVNLDVNGADFLSTAGPANNIVNPDLKWGRTHEATVSLERELVPNVALRGLYVYKRIVQETGSQTFVNVLRPYDVWNQAFTRRDPGPDGILNNADDGGSVIVTDYNPAYRGARFVANILPNVPSDRSDFFHNVEVALTKRPGTGRWYANTSFLATRNHRWLQAVAETPNANYFPLDETWDKMFRLAGGYHFPYGLTVSSLYQIFSGTKGQRVNIFRAADPDRGPSFPSSSTITLRMEPFGSQSLPTRQLLNLRLSKRLGLGASRNLTLNLDAYNALNTNVAFTANFQSGPNFGYATTISEPRALRFGATFDF